MRHMIRRTTVGDPDVAVVDVSIMAVLVVYKSALGGNMRA